MFYHGVAMTSRYRQNFKPSWRYLFLRVIVPLSVSNSAADYQPIKWGYHNDT